MLEQRSKHNKRSGTASQNAVIKKQQCGHNQIKYVNCDPCKFWEKYYKKCLYKHREGFNFYTLYCQSHAFTI